MALKTAGKRGRHGNVPVIFPADDLSELEFSELPEDGTLNLTITKARAPKVHRLYWAMLSKIAENMDQPVDREVLHKWVKTRLGVVEFVPLANGEVDEVLGSTSFEAMDEIEFRRFFNRAVDLLLESVIYMDKEELLREVHQMLGIPRPEDYQ